MTSVTYSVWQTDDLKVSIPQTNPITHYYINDERFQLVENHLVQNSLVVYELSDGCIKKGKDYQQWVRWVNDPIKYKTLIGHTPNRLFVLGAKRSATSLTERLFGNARKNNIVL